jgi:hypothetical protein
MRRDFWLALALLAACGRAQDSSGPAAASPGMVMLHGLQAPPRTQFDGTPDSCELLAAAAPQEFFGGAAMRPAQRVYGLCLFETVDSQTGTAEKSIGLEIRRDKATTPRSVDEFWEREGYGAGLEMSEREQLRTLDSLGDFAAWHPAIGGLRLFAYWKGNDMLVLTIRGATPERALPWARALAERAIRAGS